MIPDATPSFWARRLPVLPVLLVGAVLAAGSFAATSAFVGGDDSNDAEPSAAPSGKTGNDAVEPVPGGYQLDSEDVETFQLVLVVGKDRQDQLSQILLACAPGGTISGIPSTVASDVPIDEGAFSAESDEVEIAGRFVSSTSAEGTIQSRSADAEECGVPRTPTRWTVTCSLAVGSGDGLSLEPAGPGSCGQSSGGRGVLDEGESAADRERPVDTGPALATIDTRAGPLAVRSIAKTDEYPPECSTGADNFGCTTSTDGARIVVITLSPAPGKTAQETMDALEGEGGFSSGEALEATIEEEGFDPLQAFLVSTAADGIEIAFAYLFSEDAKSVTLAWPGNPPVELNF